jgi:hypothetical protein
MTATALARVAPSRRGSRAEISLRREIVVAHHESASVLSTVWSVNTGAFARTVFLLLLKIGSVPFFDSSRPSDAGPVPHLSCQASGDRVTPWARIGFEDVKIMDGKTFAQKKSPAWLSSLAGRFLVRLSALTPSQLRQHWIQQCQRQTNLTN